MKYLTLFRLEILHAYYPDQRCPDLQIEPTPWTQKLLDDCRCILKPLPNGVQALVMVNEKDRPFIPLPSDPVFVFGLRLQNPDFGLFTDLTAYSQAAAPLYTQASPATSGELTLTSREAWFTEHFAVREPSTKEAFSLSGRPLANLKTAGAFTVKGLAAKTGRKVYDEKARVLVVNSAAVHSGTPFTVTYPTLPRLERGVFAEAEIKYDAKPASLAGDVHSFQIGFKPKEARWKYYVLTDKADNISVPPAIEDKDKAIFFNAEDRTDLTQTPDASDLVAARLAEQHPDKQLYRFLSSALVPCRAAARKNIQFQFNGQKVIDALPNPSLQNYSMDLRNATQEYTLHHIVKYFTH